MMSPFTIVSSDGHANCPPDLWRTYIEPKYHDLIPQLEIDNQTHGRTLDAFTEYSSELVEILDDQNVIRSGGRRGFWDLETRIREMDREGIAAEVVYVAGPDIISMWMTMGNRAQPVEVQDAGRRAYHRWLADRLRDDEGRLLVVGDAGQCLDMEAALSELTFMKEHGFFGLWIPGNLPHPDMPPIYDKYFDPFWSACEEMGLHLTMHAGYGNEQGTLNPQLEELAKEMKKQGSGFLEQFISNTSKSFFAFDPLPRKAMWELMLGGVFDRHPKLRLLISEVRADWVPATLARLDHWYEQSRGDVPAKRKPSEYWQEFCMAGMSFMKRSEVDMRDEIGVDKMAFGRDYPHREGTWPKTREHLQALFAGVPENEVRLMVGENMIDFFGLDRAKLEAIAARVNAPTPAELLEAGEVPALLVDAFARRSGFLKPPETVDVTIIDELVEAELPRLQAMASST